MGENEEGNNLSLLTWDKLARAYEAGFMDLDLYNDTYSTLCALLPQAAQVLELACGPGNITRFLLGQRPDLRILATDASPGMLSLAQKNNPLAKCRVLDARNLSGLGLRFNAIVAGFFLPYISRHELNGFFRDLESSVSREGMLYLSFVEGDPEASGYQTGSTGDRMWFNYHNLAEVLALAATHNFGLRHKWVLPFKRTGREDELHTVLIFSANH